MNCESSIRIEPSTKRSASRLQGSPFSSARPADDMARVLPYSEGIVRNSKMLRHCFLLIRFWKTAHSAAARRDCAKPFQVSKAQTPFGSFAQMFTCHTHAAQTKPLIIVLPDFATFCYFFAPNRP